jgi:Putative zinc- or iron-chelating domain
MMLRQCGDCTLCCKLLPMRREAYSTERVAETAAKMVEAGWATAGSFAGMLPDFDKPAGKPCPHQTHHHGCKVYTRRPFGCRYWNCRWLVNDDTADLRRPDRSRYVIDLMPDFVTVRPHDGAPPTNIQVVQIWVDPKHRDAWRDPALLAYLDRRGQEGTAALIRWSESDAITVFPPSLSADAHRQRPEHRPPAPRRRATDRTRHDTQGRLDGMICCHAWTSCPI